MSILMTQRVAVFSQGIVWDVYQMDYRQILKCIYKELLLISHLGFDSSLQNYMTYVLLSDTINISLYMSFVCYKWKIRIRLKKWIKIPCIDRLWYQCDSQHERASRIWTRQITHSPKLMVIATLKNTRAVVIQFLATIWSLDTYFLRCVIDVFFFNPQDKLATIEQYQQPAYSSYCRETRTSTNRALAANANKNQTVMSIIMIQIMMMMIIQTQRRRLLMSS